MNAPALAPRRPNRWAGPCHRCNAHVRAGAGMLASHPFAPRRSIVVCGRCEPAPVCGGHDGPARPQISAAAAMMAGNAYAHALRHGGPVDALGEIARLCAWASGDKIVVSLVAATDDMRRVDAGPQDDEWADTPEVATSGRETREIAERGGDDLVAEILSRASVPADADRIAETIAAPAPTPAVKPRNAGRRPAWTKR